MWESLRPVFADPRNFERARRLGFGLLATTGRHTITAMIGASGRAQHDWSADYRLFSRGDWDSGELLSALVPSVLALDPAYKGVNSTEVTRPVVASLDDTCLKKTGPKIPGVKYRRDPMSPPFHTNLIRAQRFIQTSIAVPFELGPSACRAIPIAFDHAPTVKKPGAKATDQDKAAYRQAQRTQNLSTQGVEAIGRVRQALDRAQADQRTLLITVDGSYTNKTVLNGLPERTDLVGRIRKDAVLHYRPTKRNSVGRPRLYGDLAPTPNQLRQDDSVPWEKVKVFAAGREHTCQIKQLNPVLWRRAGTQRVLRLIVIRPLAYKRTKAGRTLYRQPAYLITTDLSSSIEQILQAYFWRWDIEVNHRDEKQLIGVGQAQVRSQKSAARVPAFAVACYSILLIAAANTFGLNASKPRSELPLWQTKTASSQVRLTTPQLLSILHHELAPKPVRSELPNFSHFAHAIERRMKCPKGSLSPTDAIHYAVN